MLSLLLDRRLSCLFAILSLCSCADEEAPSEKDGDVEAAPRGSTASTSSDGGHGEGAGDSAPEAGSAPHSFESLGPIACQTAAPEQRVAAAACRGPAFGCDALAERLAQLPEACAYELNENALEVFFEEGCAVGITQAREDPNVTAEARHCLSEEIAALRAGCFRPVCIRLEHSTLAAL
jgi:hypothetical protein